MSTKLSKQVHDLTQRANQAIQTLYTYETTLSNELAQRWKEDPSSFDTTVLKQATTNLPTEAGVLPPSPEQLAQGLMPFASPTSQDIQDLLRAFGRHLVRSVGRMQQADQEVFRETKEDQTAIEARDQAVENAREALQRVRFGLSASYGSAWTQTLGLEGSLSEDATEILQYTERLKTRLQSKGLVWPQPIEPDFPAWTKEMLHTQLDRVLSTLRGRTEALVRENKETQQARILRNERLQETQSALSALNSIMETIARLNKQTEIANRIRPAGRRSTHTLPDEGNDTPTNTDTNTDANTNG